MKAKIFLSSIVTIALCLSLIVGSTFALFETEKKVNIAVTAGKVDVKASIPETTFEKNIYAGNDNASLDTTNNVITINNFLPKDEVKFNIEVANNSNVPIQYKVSAKSNIKNTEKDLLDVLVCTVKLNNKTYTMKANGDTFDTGYIAATSDTELTTIEVTLAFPVFSGDVNSNAYTMYQSYQGANSSITFLVEAVQGNGATTNP